MSFSTLGVLAIVWILLALPVTLLLVRRKLDSPVWAGYVGALAVVLLPPLGLLHLFALTLMPDAPSTRKESPSA